MNKSTVYLLLSLKDNRTYLGSTDNLTRRLKEHKDGKVFATKYRRPLKLFYKEEFKTTEEARKRERYYKTSAGRKKLKEIINRDRPPRLDEPGESRRV
ncbi:MAG: GIY-YIG nuclease family protein [bacterium]|nr:GIY-YIG nuclease family protein [bacterium]